MKTPMNASQPLRDACEEFARDVRQALDQVPQEIAESAVGHAALAGALVRIAADILNRQGNAAFLEDLVRSLDAGGTAFSRYEMKAGLRASDESRLT